MDTREEQDITELLNVSCKNCLEVCNRVLVSLTLWFVIETRESFREKMTDSKGEPLENMC
jgi:hypothetical protein